MSFVDKVLRILEKPLENGVHVTTTQKELFQLLCDESARKVPSVLRVSVRIFQEGKNQLGRFVAVSGDWPSALLEGVFEIDKNSAGAYAIQSKKPLVVNKAVQRAPHCQDDREILRDVQSHVSIPVLSRRLNAVLSIDSKDEGSFDEEQVRILEFMAAKTALALERFSEREDFWLLDLERTLSQEFSLNSLCWKALRRTVEIFGVRGGSLFLWDAQRDGLRCVATIPKENAVANVKPYRLGDGLTGWVAKTRSVLRLHDTGSEDERARIDPQLHWANHFSELTDPSDVVGRRTFLAAPMIVQNDLIGVIRLTIRQEYADFTANDEILIESVARLLALAVQNIRHREESERSLRQLHIFDELSRQAAGKFDVETLARVVFRKGLEILRSDEGHVRIYNSTTKTLDLVDCEGEHCNFAAKRRPLGRGISGRVAENRQPLVFEDIQTDEQFQEMFKEEPEFLNEVAAVRIRSEACYPLIAGQELIGTLTFHWKDASRVGGEEGVLFQSLVDRGALALKAALAFREREAELGHHRAALTRLHQAEEEFVQRPDVGRLLRHFLYAAIAESGIRSGTVRTLNSTGDVWELRAAVGDESEYPNIDDSLEAQLPSTLKLLEQASSTRKAMKIFDSDPVFQEFKSYFPEGSYHRKYLETISSMLVAPMRMGQQCKGLIFLCSHEPADLPDRTVMFLEILASLGAIAIHNTQLLAEREKALELATPLAMIGAVQGGFQHVLGGSLQTLDAVISILEHPKFNIEMLPNKVRALRQEVARLARYREDVMHFMKSPGVSVREPLDINISVEKGIVDNKARFQSEIKLEKSLSSRLPKSVGNYAAVQQAIGMIISNALDAMPGGGTLRVETFAEDNNIHVRIADTGVGMDAATLQRVRAGEMFFSTKLGSGGTGLGLAIARQVLSKHQGDLRIDSTPGKGTAVEIWLPSLKEPTYATAANGR